jgi:hypothetical protein
MNDLKQRPWWRRNPTVTPEAAVLIGIAFGSALGGLVAFPWFLGSYVPWLFAALMGGLFGYLLRTFHDRAGAGMQPQVLAVVLLPLGPALLEAWRQVGRAGGGTLTFLAMLAGVIGASMCLVGIA